MSKLVINIEPALRCQYLPECGGSATQALIWTNELLPIRWVMMPVCPSCLSAARLMYAPKNGDNSGNQVGQNCPKEKTPRSILVNNLKSQPHEKV